MFSMPKRAVYLHHVVSPRACALVVLCSARGIDLAHAHCSVCGQVWVGAVWGWGEAGQGVAGQGGAGWGWGGPGGGAGCVTKAPC